MFCCFTLSSYNLLIFPNVVEGCNVEIKLNPRCEVFQTKCLQTVD